MRHFSGNLFSTPLWASDLGQGQTAVLSLVWQDSDGLFLLNRDWPSLCWPNPDLAAWGDLCDCLLAKGKFTKHDVVAVNPQCHHYLHRHGTVHRDLKYAWFLLSLCFFTHVTDPKTSSTAPRTPTVTLSSSTLACESSIRFPPLCSFIFFIEPNSTPPTSNSPLSPALLATSLPKSSKTPGTENPSTSGPQVTYTHARKRTRPIISLHIRATVTAIEVLLTFIRFTMTYKTQMAFGDGMPSHISHMKTSTRLLYVFYRDGTLLFIPWVEN